MASEAYPTCPKAWLAKLVSFDTTSRNSNLPIIHYIQGYLHSLGIKSFLAPNPEGTKANLFATLPATDGSTKGGIILSGHTDVVPVDGQKWDSDPFVLTERDGKLYGRGACDMKGFIAVVLFLTPKFLSLPRQKPVYYAFSFDEELGCLGIPYLIRSLQAKNFTADVCLVGENTGMKVVTGNKGFCVWKVKVHGKAIHSSLALMNTSCNAIEYAALIIRKIRQIALELKKTDTQDAHYPCPFSCISTGLFSGGNAVNTVPAYAEFTFSLRVTKTETVSLVEDQVKSYMFDVILPQMREEYKDASITIERGADFPPYNANEDDPFTQKVRELTGDKGPIRKLGGGTEAGFFQELLKIPTVIAGPGGAAAHEANEYGLESQLLKCRDFLLELIPYYTGGGQTDSKL